MSQTNVSGEDSSTVRCDSGETTSDSLRPLQNNGSGVIVSDAGDILTSLHIVAAANSIQVTFADGTVAFAEIIGTLSDDDIAV